MGALEMPHLAHATEISETGINDDQGRCKPGVIKKNSENPADRCNGH